ncbi:MAG TPA: hypothetical protein VJG32_11020 [Anaerolineae bacterium]|nr:hypothetical protein [Anaerolineae bacterium]
MLKRVLAKFNSPLVLGAGVAIGGVGQAPSDPVQIGVTLLVVAACLLPILMAIFGGVVMRFLSWFTRGPKVEDEVVYPRPMLPRGVHLPDPTIWPAVLAFGLMGLMFAVVLQSWIILGAGVLLTLLGVAGWIVVEVKEFRPASRRKP